MKHSHELGELLADLGAWCVELRTNPTDPARLRHRPASLPTALSEALRRHRGAILLVLSDGYTPDDDDAAYVCTERLGIGDGLGMATHPGSTAWLIAVAESMGANQ